MEKICKTNAQFIFLLTVYTGVEDYVGDSERGEDDVAEIFHSLNGFEDLEPGWYLLMFSFPTKRTNSCIFIEFLLLYILKR